MTARFVVMAVSASALAAFGGVLDNAWIKGTTDRDPIAYKSGEQMTFTLTAEGVEGRIPAGECFLEWARSGDDGIRENGKDLIASGGSQGGLQTVWAAVCGEGRDFVREQE